MTHRILVVDDSSLSRVILRAKLGAACYDVVLAPDGESALRATPEMQPDLVLMDCGMPGLSGPEVCAALRREPRWAHLPVILFSADVSRERSLAALAAGAQDVLPKPLNEPYLLARIRCLLRGRDVARHREPQGTPSLRHALAKGVPGMPSSAVACILPDADTPSLARHLAGEVLSVAQTLKPMGGKTPADVLVIAPELLARDGLSVIADLRARPATRNAAIVAVMPNSCANEHAMALDMGADEVLSLPLDPEEVALRFDALRARKAWADHVRHALQAELDLASRDALTGLHNRRHVLSCLAELMAQGEAEFAVLLVDLDEFKKINDTYGHLAGDEVLVSVAQRMRSVIRKSDLVARYGGEEFLILLPGVGARAAHQMAERVRHAIGAAPHAARHIDQPLQVTGSIGVMVHERSEHWAGADVSAQIEAVIEAADRALHRAKGSGRNCIALGLGAVA